MTVATDPFVDVLWTLLISCLWAAWLVLLCMVVGDVFRRRDLSGWGKTAWVVVAILLPFLGVLAYMATQKDGLTERRSARAAAKELEKAEFLRDIGAITQVELDTVKQKAPNARLA
jgi:Phospholipase_D-nuclease N-terminal